ncbi:hypothetical protein [Psychromonas aquimarina]|uniref:hypothetical protein n=1 Tax=Psychromonas aquimarina TaxID=444919 RepID=UPI00040E5644|nr:hypothetical protein [Psychromonas aquimarina]
MTSDINITFNQPDNGFFTSLIKKIGPGNISINNKVWLSFLKNTDKVLWQGLCEYPCFEGDLNIENLELDGQKAELWIMSGSFAFDYAPFIVQILTKAGCSDVFAIVSTDECEWVEDDNGESLPVGLSYRMHENGCVLEEGYPKGYEDELDELFKGSF